MKFILEITTTHECSLRCSYCAEQNKNYQKLYFKNEQLPLIYNLIESLFNQHWFNQKYDSIQITFWGGEPTLNSKLIKNLFKKYIYDDRITFFMYSNGYSSFNVLHEDILKMNQRKLKNTEKVFVQISYDGKILQDLNRKTKNNKNTSEHVLSNIKWLTENNIPHSIKSTIKINELKYIYESYSELKKLFQNKETLNSSYFPTIDYFSDYSNILNFNQIYDELKENLIKIAKEEILFYKNNNRFFFHWFNPNRAICSAGINNIQINTDNNAYVCHGALYSNNKNDHLIGNISNPNFINKLKDSITFHQHIFKDTCSDCFTTYCLKCNTTKYDTSNKQTYEERWNDSKNQPLLCDLYKLVGKVRLSMNKFTGI